MGQRNLNAINRQSGPINTLTRRSPVDSPRQRPNPVSRPSEPAPKRRKQDGSQAFIQSHYFASSQGDRLAEFDFIEDGSLDDPVDVRSTSSAGNRSRSSNAVATTVSEFRNAQTPKFSRASSRNRKKRSSHSSSSRSGRPMTASSRGSTAPESPDVLTIDDPAPAKITSDLTPQRGVSKRRLPFPSSISPAKRSKSHHADEVIEDSEDELQSPQRKEGGKRRTNFSGTTNRQPSKVSSRADIKPVEFTPSKKQPLSRPALPDSELLIRKAISGAHMWRADKGCLGRLDPHYTQNPKEPVDVFLPISVQGDTLPPWLGVSVSAIQNVSHAEEQSSFVQIKRSIVEDTPQDLLLEFDSEKGAARFISLVPKARWRPPEFLSKVFQRAESEAERAIANSSRRSSGRDEQARLLKSPADRLENSSKPAQAEQTQQKSTLKPQKLKDQMQPGAPESFVRSKRHEDSQASAVPEELLSTTRRQTRQSLPNLTAGGTVPESWTSANPNWEQKWQKSLVFPATGRNRATVDAEDIKRLDEGEFLNDNLISFYLRYLQSEIESKHPELITKVHIFSSFFFEKLRSTKGKINYEGVRSWTAKVDLFSYDYLVVPVNEHAHWYLAIVCNVGKWLAPPASEDEGDVQESVEEVAPASSPKMPSVEKGVKTISLEDNDAPSSSTADADDVIISSPLRGSKASNQGKSAKSRQRRSFGAPAQKFNPKDPRIITLDSLGSAHSPTCKALREYIAEEARDKKGVLPDSSIPGMTGKGIPEQDNFCDCGVFVLGYMEEFLKNPDEAARKLLQKESTGWAVNPSRLRSKIRNLLFDLQSEQQTRIQTEREQKRQAVKAQKAAARLEAGRSQDPSPKPSPNLSRATSPKSLTAALPKPPNAESSKPSRAASPITTSEGPITESLPPPSRAAEPKATSESDTNEPKPISRTKLPLATLLNPEPSPVDPLEDSSQEELQVPDDSPKPQKASTSAVDAHKSAQQHAEFKYVQPLPSSESDDTTRRTKSHSTDGNNDVDWLVRSSPSHNRSTPYQESTYFQKKPSRERENVPPKAHYDGIDRSGQSSGPGQ